MILISHRGNIDGPMTNQENKPAYVDSALALGYDVEVDIWYIHSDNPQLFLGHDEPQYEISFEWLAERINRLWIHCKNIEAVEFFAKHEYNYNFFWHEEDAVTLTARKYIWAYPGKQPIKNSIAVMPELYHDDLSDSLGVCSDYVINYK